MEMQTTKCKRCGGRIVFIRTQKGKQMPCNAKAVPYLKDEFGQSQIMTRGGQLLRCNLDIAPEDASGYGYLPHFGSCISKEGQARMEAMKKQHNSPLPPPQIKKAVKSPAPEVEQLCLFGANDRRSRHPI